MALGVETKDFQVLLVQEGHLGAKQVVHVLRAVYHGTVFGVQGDLPPPQLQGRLDLACLGLADSLDVAQLLEAGPPQAPQSVQAAVLGEHRVAMFRTLSPTTPVRRSMAMSSAVLNAAAP